MIGDRRAGLASDRAALHALQRIAMRLLHGALGDGDAFEADVEAGVVHHGEHVFEAAIGLADQKADRAALFAIGHHRRGAGVDAELVLDRGADDIVALAGRAVGIDQEFGDHEQRDALDAGRGVGQARQHEMDDVFGDVVLAPGDENLRAGDAVGVAVGNRARAHRRQIGARLRFRQVHGARPFAGGHFGQVERLLGVRAVMRDRRDRAHGEHLAQRERQIGRRPHFQHGRVDQLRQPLPAPFSRRRHGVPAVAAEGGEGGFHPRRAWSPRRPCTGSQPRRRAGSAAPARRRRICAASSKMCSIRSSETSSLPGQRRDLVEAADGRAG